MGVYVHVYIYMYIYIYICIYIYILCERVIMCMWIAYVAHVVRGTYAETHAIWVCSHFVRLLLQRRDLVTAR